MIHAARASVCTDRQTKRIIGLPPVLSEYVPEGIIPFQAYRMNFGEEASTPATFAKSGTEE